MIEENNKVKIKYRDRINKVWLELEVDKSVRRAINKYNKKEKRQIEKLKEFEVLSLDQLEENDFEIPAMDFNIEQQELERLEQKRQREIRLKLYRAMRVLAPRQKEVVSMYYFEKKTYREIANELEITISGVREILYQSYEKMRKIIKK